MDEQAALCVDRANLKSLSMNICERLLKKPDGETRSQTMLKKTLHNKSLGGGGFKRVVFSPRFLGK